MIEDILTEDALCKITGHHTREGLKAWLTEHKVIYVVAKSGWPRVHRKALERAMGVVSVEHIEMNGEPIKFNFDALNT